MSEQLNNFSQEDLAELMQELEMARRKYIKKQGTYMSGIPNRKYTDQVNENRITAAIQSIDVIIAAYARYKSLTKEQVVFAQKMIKKGFSLGMNSREKED